MGRAGSSDADWRDAVQPSEVDAETDPHREFPDEPLWHYEEWLDHVLNSDVCKRAGDNSTGVDWRATVTDLVRQAAWSRALQRDREHRELRTVVLTLVVSLAVGSSLGIVAAAPAGTWPWWALLTAEFVGVVMWTLLLITAVHYRFTSTWMFGAALFGFGAAYGTLVNRPSEPISGVAAILVCVFLAGAIVLVTGVLAVALLSVWARVTSRRSDPWPWVICALVEAVWRLDPTVPDDEASESPSGIAAEFSHLIRSGRGRGPLGLMDDDGVLAFDWHEVRGPIATRRRRQAVAGVLVRAAGRLRTNAAAIGAHRLTSTFRSVLTERAESHAAWLEQHAADLLEPSRHKYERVRQALAQALVQAATGDWETLRAERIEPSARSILAQAIPRVGVAIGALAVAVVLPDIARLDDQATTAVRGVLILAAVSALIVPPEKALDKILQETSGILSKQQRSS